MEIKIISEKENHLFKRKELILETHSEISPKKIAVIEKIAEKFSATPETITVKKISGIYGTHLFKIICNIYKTKEDKELFEKEKNKKEIKKEEKQEEKK